ncbi:NAD(P)/FAD-dependent oxidoreductase [Chryseosolibacter indicus]|uniref:NAD(P)/FAD-dependent oxidoreductase n=1 Tax=Chryseosolibacter indicus TaxID=2782351 RepID=A0ABS5VRX1_9BACT|nr:NAD(P)/FAD-dependent oxidoreductase [Chryseosolibacter indicus]MBT1704091.1 NAD(P)/FAD-dependent oxidoreductase [Chryseosolibacter indicus]
MTNTKDTWDVVIIGGSYAGLSAAMALGRSLRKVLVVDSGMPCNAQTPHSHNFLTQDGKTPFEISTTARQQVAAYNTVQILNDLVVKADKTAQGFDVALQSGTQVGAKKLIFATGIRDQLLNIPGFSSCWGISVVHCPYCHGYEYHGKKTAILANGEGAMHYALLVGHLTKQLQILTNGKPEFTEEQMAKLRKHNIPINDSAIIEIEHERGYLKNVIMSGGNKIQVDALYFRPPFKQHTDIPKLLGCEFTEHGYIKVDTFQKTTVDGVYACGDNSSMMRSVANAVSTGNFAGASLNKELAMEQF